MSVTYFYGCDGVSDYGWGCVWRCTQGFLARMGHPVPPLYDMMRTLDIPVDPEHIRKMWIEPIDARRLLPFSTRLVLYGDERHAGCMMRTTWQDADQHLSTASGVLSFLTEALTRGPVMMDDGTYGYLLVAASKDDNTFQIMDPHRTTQQYYMVTPEWIVSRNLWMLLAVAP